MVGAAGFEPATCSSQNYCATGLRYTPKSYQVPVFTLLFCNPAIISRTFTIQKRSKNIFCKHDVPPKNPRDLQLLAGAPDLDKPGLFALQIASVRMWCFGAAIPQGYSVQTPSCASALAATASSMRSSRRSISRACRAASSNVISNTKAQRPTGSSSVATTPRLNCTSLSSRGDGVISG